MSSSSVIVHNDNVKYTEEYITSNFTYTTSEATVSPDGVTHVTPKNTNFTLRTTRQVPKVGVMLVGLGGNNGSTVVGGIIANKHKLTWRDKNGEYAADYFGSLTQASTLDMGMDPESGQSVHVPFKDVLPMVHPNDLVVGGWDISNKNLAECMERSAVFDFDLQQKLKPFMEKIVPKPSIYYPDFIAANQKDRATNLIPGIDKWAHVEQLRKDIKTFKRENGLDKVVVQWTANTERFADIITGINDTADNLIQAIKDSHTEISPSTVFAVASILEGCTYINGSPQNTFVPGVLELAEREGVFVSGDDFKSGQTKFKSVLVDFLVGAGIKPVSIVSYNHLGNNDGKNLSAPKQFRSKEITKSNVVDDMVASNPILYKEDEHPDHCVVIKYVPAVGDSKRAMDEYTSKIFMNGTNTIVCHNTCEDSLLASPLIIDLVVLAELFERVQYKTDKTEEFKRFNSVLSQLGFLIKAPLTNRDEPVVNALFKQRSLLENTFRACLGLPAQHHMSFEHTCSM